MADLALWVTRGDATMLYATCHGNVRMLRSPMFVCRAISGFRVAAVFN